VEGTGQPVTSGAGGANTEALDLGATLREMRLALKRDLDDLADELRIRPSFLQAIEEGRFGDLPGTTYALGFVRAYADAVGFDSEEALRRYKAATGGSSPAPNLSLPAPVPSGGLPTGAVLLAGAILAVLAYGGWYVLSTQGEDPGAMVASISGKIAGAVRDALPERGPDAEKEPPAVAISLAPRAERDASAPAMAKPTSPETTAAENAETTEAVDEEEDVPPPPPEQVTNEAPPPAVATPSATAHVPAASPAAGQAAPPPRASAPPPAAPAPQQAALPAVPESAISNPALHRVVLVARADSWVELRDASGAAIYSRVLRKDERYEVPEKDGLVMMTGNAGGLEVLVDGQVVPTLGAPGAVKRNISLDPDKLRAGTAVPPAAAPQPTAPAPAAPQTSPVSTP
jgi:cytoskeleton protein RodZ